MCRVAHRIPAPLGKQQYNFTDGQKDFIPYIGVVPAPARKQDEVVLPKLGLLPVLQASSVWLLCCCCPSYRRGICGALGVALTLTRCTSTAPLVVTAQAPVSCETVS